MAWLLANLSVVLTVLLVISEAAAAVSQLIWPSNQGVSGVLAAIIKALQALGAKDPVPPAQG